MAAAANAVQTPGPVMPAGIAQTAEKKILEAGYDPWEAARETYATLEASGKTIAQNDDQAEQLQAIAKKVTPGTMVEVSREFATVSLRPACSPADQQENFLSLPAQPRRGAPTTRRVGYAPQGATTMEAFEASFDLPLSSASYGRRSRATSTAAAQGRRSRGFDRAGRSSPATRFGSALYVDTTPHLLQPEVKTPTSGVVMQPRSRRTAPPALMRPGDRMWG